MVRPPDSREAFRCVVAPEDSAATLRLDGKKISCRVLDTSRSGFSVQVPVKYERKIERSQRRELLFNGERWTVDVSSKYADSDELCTFGFSRIRELTKFKQPSGWKLALAPKANSNADPMFLLYLTIAFLVACICLPGIGDNLGTAPKVRKGVQTVIKTLKGN